MPQMAVNSSRNVQLKQLWLLCQCQGLFEPFCMTKLRMDGVQFITLLYNAQISKHRELAL